MSRLRPQTCIAKLWTAQSLVGARQLFTTPRIKGAPRKLLAAKSRKPSTASTQSPSNTYNAAELRSPFRPTDHLLESNPAVDRRELIQLGGWTAEEDALLLQGVSRHQFDWAQVASRIPMRSTEQCEARWVRLPETLRQHALSGGFSKRDDKDASSDEQLLSTSSSAEEDPDVIGIARRRKSTRLWSVNEDKLLHDLVEYYGTGWTQIAGFMPERDSNSILCRWRFTQSRSFKRGRWTDEEDMLLHAAVARHPTGAWALIAADVPDRTERQCAIRWLEGLAPGIRKGRWESSEVDRLYDLVAMYGFRWKLISDQLGSRTLRQCRTKWLNLLRPGKSTGNWQPDEDERLLAAARKYGLVWEKVSRAVGGRNIWQCKARWDVKLDWTASHEAWTKEEDQRLLGIVLNMPGDPKRPMFDWYQCAEQLKNRNNVQCRIRYRSLYQRGLQHASDQGDTLANRIYTAYLSEYQQTPLASDRAIGASLFNFPLQDASTQASKDAASEEEDITEITYNQLDSLDILRIGMNEKGEAMREVSVSEDDTSKEDGEDEDDDDEMDINLEFIRLLKSD